MARPPEGSPENQGRFQPYTEFIKERLNKLFPGDFRREYLDRVFPHPTASNQSERESQKSLDIKCYFNREAGCGPNCAMFPGSVAKMMLEKIEGQLSQERTDEIARLNNIRLAGCREYLSRPSLTPDY